MSTADYMRQLELLERIRKEGHEPIILDPKSDYFKEAVAACEGSPVEGYIEKYIYICEICEKEHLVSDGRTPEKCEGCGGTLKLLF